MNPVDRLARRLRRFVKDANALGFAIVADCEGISIRIMTLEEAKRSDIRALGETVAINDACGGPTSVNLDAAG